MNPLAELPRTAAVHVQLRCYGAVLALRQHATAQRFPFLDDYCREPARWGVADPGTWSAAVREWERDVDLPLNRLAAAAHLDEQAVDALFLLGLVDEDARFAVVFEELTGCPHPTPGLLNAWWPGMRPGLRSLVELGIAEPCDPDARSVLGAQLRVAALVWDALQGIGPSRAVAWVRYFPAAAACGIDELVLSPDVEHLVRRAPAALTSGMVGGLILRGPAGSGRRTIVGAIAAAAGLGMLEIDVPEPDGRRWAQAGSLAALLGALPVVVAGSGRTAHLSALGGRPGPFAIVAGLSGGMTGDAPDRSVTVTLGVPAAAERAAHWRAAGAPAELVDELAACHRMTGGNIRRTVGHAAAAAALAGRETPVHADFVTGARARRARLLESLAARVDTVDDRDALAVAGQTREELALLEVRCRHRESLAGTRGTDRNAGVRALFTGPSGTGKTLAARMLAGVLGIDLYRVDLAVVVDKYIGETEKNLSRLFAAAEEADAALLLDEGDSLMTRRTDVTTSHDRYANLETNFLLQRLETFEGILLVTSNGADRIDRAFRRRMDVIVDFAPPDELARWCIWQQQLPAGHAVAGTLLEDVAERCVLTGGQIRNAVLHAVLLGMEHGGTVGSAHVVSAVRREYAKLGHACPLGAGVTS